MARSRNVISNPRYHAQHLTWTGFKETGIWVIARIMFVPTIVFCLFYFGQQAIEDIPGNAMKDDASFGSIGQVLGELDLDLPGVLGGNASDGTIWGFGVGSAPATTGAKWARP